MKVGEFFLLIGKSLTPHSYKQLSSIPTRQAFEYLVTLLGMVFLITIILYIPFFTDASLDKSLSKITKLSVNVDLETSEPIYSKNFGMAVDTTGKFTNLTNENILVTKNQISFLPLRCMLFKPLCLFSKDSAKTVDLDSQNLLDKKSSVREMVPSFLLLLIPTVVIILFLIYLIKYVIIVFMISIIAFIITRIRLYEVHFLKTVKLAAYTLTPVIIIEIINLRFGFNLYFIHWIIFVILFAIGMMMIGEKAIKHKEE